MANTTASKTVILGSSPSRPAKFWHRLEHMFGWNRIHIVSSTDDNHDIWIASKCVTCGKVTNKHMIDLHIFPNMLYSGNVKFIPADSNPPPDESFTDGYNELL